MRVSFATAPGSDRPNEDWCAATPQAVVVLDGLSTSGLDTGCRHGVPWFVQRLAGQLLALADDLTNTLPDALGRAIDNVAAMHPECDTSHPGTPSSTVAVLREMPDRLEYLVLADAAVVLDMSTGIDVITDLRVDAVAREELAETRRHPVGSPAHQRSVAALVRAQRRVRNTAAGYWVAAGDPTAAAYATVGAVQRSSVRRAAVLSDGAARLVTPFGAATWRDALDIMSAEGAAGLIDRVRRLEAEDPKGVRWPRFKASDDATAAFCALANL